MPEQGSIQRQRQQQQEIMQTMQENVQVNAFRRDVAPQDTGGADVTGGEPPFVTIPRAARTKRNPR